MSANRFRGRFLALAVTAVVLALWLSAGIRTFEPSSEIAVLDGPLPGPFPMRLERGWAVAPAGLLRVYRYPAHGRDVPLPDAPTAMLAGEQGTRYGFRGWATLRVEADDWRTAHREARDGGLERVLADAVVEVAQGLDAGGIHRAMGDGPYREALGSRLREALAERGIGMRRLDVEGLDFLGVEEGETLPDPGTKLLVIGLDGADWEIIDPLLAQGRLPNLKRLIDNGARGKLLTISPMLSPVIWTTVATGVEPSKHGILDFLVNTEEGDEPQPVTSLQRTAPTVWNLLSDQGIGVGIVAWWATWPAEQVDGYIVSDRIAYQLFDYRSDPEDSRGKTWPAGLYEESVRPLLKAPDGISWGDRVVPFLSGSRTRPEQFDAEETELLEGLRTLLASGDGYVEIARDLSERFRPRFEAVYLEGTDTVGHLFMSYRPPKLPGVPERRFESFRDIVDRYYDLADRYLGELLEGRGDEWTVMIVSDHGFASDATRPWTADSRIGHGQAAAWHRRFGVIVLSGRHVKPGVRLDEASVYDVAPTVLALFGQPVPQPWPGEVLVDALDPEFVDSYPVRILEAAPERDMSRVADAMLEADPASEEMLAKLQALGYIGTTGGASGEQAAEEGSLTFINNAGVALMGEGKYVEAEKTLREGLQAYPGNPMLLVNLGVVLERLGRIEEARETLEQATRHPNAQRSARFRLAQMAISEGDLAGAEKHLRAILAREPDAAEVINQLGLLKEKAGDRERAEELYRRAATLDPNAAQPRVNLGNMARYRGDAEAAETWYLAAIEADPFFMGAYNNLALVYQDRNDLDRAIDLYRRALEKSPTNPIVLNNLASLYYAKGETEEAKKQWQRCIRANPQYPSPYNNLAGLALTEERLDDAEGLLQAALRLDPGYGDALINLASVRQRSGRPEDAVDLLEKAVEDPRARPKARLHLARLQLRLGRVREGLTQLEAARGEPGGSSPPVLNLLGEVYASIGRRGDAEAAWRESLRLDASQDPIRKRLEQADGETSRGS